MQTFAAVRKLSTSCLSRAVARHSGQSTSKNADFKLRTQSKYASWRLHVAKTTAANIRINDSPRYVTFTHPGLNYAALDKFGNPDIVRVNELFHDVMFCSMKIATIKDGKPTNFINVRKLMETNKLFIGGIELDAKRSFYNKSIPKWPLDAKVIFGGFNRATMFLSTELSLRGGQVPLVSRSMKIACVDGQTLKPSTFPTWFQDDFKGREAKTKQMNFNGFERPKRTYKYRVKVVEDDTDLYNHTSYAMYFRFALSALHSAMAANTSHGTTDSLVSGESFNVTVGSPLSQPRRLWNELTGGVVNERGSTRPPAAPQLQELSEASCVKGLSPQIVSQGIASLKAVYKQQSRQDDELDVHLWQDPSEPLSFRCSIEHLDGTVCAQVQMEFFEPHHFSVDGVHSVAR